MPSQIALVEPTDDNEMHLVYILSTNSNPMASGRRTVMHSLQLDHPHTDECAFCAALAFRGEPPASIASFLNDIIPRKYRSLVKALLFPCYLLLCAEMLQWGWNIALSFLRSRAVFEADFAAHTTIKETQAEVQFYSFCLFAALAILYLRAW